MDFGRNFRKARERKGMDQKYAAEKLGVSPSFLSKIENDKDNKKPSTDMILNAAELYGVTPGFFFEGQETIDIDSLYSAKNKSFIKDLAKMTDEELKDKYRIQLDGKELTDQEIRGIMAYVRSLRSMTD